MADVYHLNNDVPWPYHFAWRAVRLTQQLSTHQHHQDCAVVALGIAAQQYVDALEARRLAVEALAAHTLALSLSRYEAQAIEDRHARARAHRDVVDAEPRRDTDA